MEPEAFLNSRDPVYEFIYNNESELEPLQYPLAFSRFKVPRFANDLYSDDASQYFTYSGSNSVIVTKEKEGRYKNLTLKAYSGDSFKFYFQVGSGIADSDAYFSGPLTTSGVYSTMTLYATQSGALANAMTFFAPTNNSSVYTLPNIQNLNWVRLYHNSVDGTTPYRIYQFIPRTLIQVDDLEADVIDAVTLRVSGSIVVSADDLAPGSITGDKIMAGTVSGVLITPGGITATQIAAGTITANKLNVTQLDAVAANMGTLVVNSGISIGTNGTIWAGAGSALSPQTGLKIYTTSGVSRLTTYSSSTPQIDIGSDGKLTAGAGKVTLDSTGLTIGTTNTTLSESDALHIQGSGAVGNIVGMALYNGAFSSVNPQAVIQLDSTNALELEMRAISGMININFPESTTTGQFLNVYNGDLYLRRSPNPPENIVGGTIYGTDSDGTIRYKLGPDQLALNNNTADTFTVNAANGRVYAAGNLHVGPGDHMFTVNGTNGNLHVGAPPHVFTVNGSTGNVTSEGDIFALGTITAYSDFKSSFLGSDYAFKVNTDGNLNTIGGIFAGASNNKFTVQSATGNTAIAGTLGVTGALTLSNNFLQFNYGGLFKNVAQNIAAGADARITFQVVYTNGTMDVVASNRLTTTYAGYYIITAGVISASVGSAFQVVTGGAFGTGTLIAGIIQADMRAYVTKPVYLGAGTNIELWVRNSGGGIIAVTTGGNGTILVASKAG